MAALFFAGLAVIAAGAIAAVALRARPRWANGAFAVLVVAGCVLIALPALGVLTGSAGWDVRLEVSVPGGAWVFGIDSLTAIFLVAIATVGSAAAVYGVGYFALEPRRGAVAVAHAGVAALLIALALVVTSRAAIPFLIAWEVMAIAAFLLVMFDHGDADTRRAGLLYLAATHTATLALITLFAVWGASAPDLTFASLARVSAFPAGVARGAVLLLALFAFGLKAGVVPLHFWLPAAHAAAPSHVSALMSGLVIKIGIYGLLRLVTLIGAVPAWYGWSLLALGVLSGVLGVVWALTQHDLKRLLAYHSVENIGIILIGMGAGALGTAYDLPVVAALGYAGALLHVVNHALFKSLLFLAAGAVARATGTRQLDALGGLARAMPVTWILFAVASAAIVGLPPLNGFVSEWTIVQALIGAGQGHGPIRVALFAVAGLGLIGGLALACFAKASGVVFLGRARTPAAAAAHEPGATLLGPMVALALACLLIGIVPALFVPPAIAAAGVIAEASHAGAGLAHDLGVLSWVAVTLAGTLAIAWALRTRRRRHERTVAQTWGCGFPAPSARVQYTASSFAAPVLEPFGGIAGVTATRTEAAFHTHPFDPGLDRVLLPAWRRLRVMATRHPWLPGRDLHVSLLYVLATVLLLLLYLALGRAA